MLLLMFAVDLSAAASKSGLIVDETWTKAESPYFIETDVRIVSLTIAAGADVKCASNTVFEIVGWLKASGTSSEPIHFGPAVPSEPWQGIFFNYTGDGSELEFCTVEGAKNSGIRVFYGAPIISNCIVTNNSSSELLSFA